jgi:hypothetical protein
MNWQYLRMTMDFGQLPEDGPILHGVTKKVCAQLDNPSMLDSKAFGSMGKRHGFQNELP